MWKHSHTILMLLFSINSAFADSANNQPNLLKIQPSHLSSQAKQQHLLTVTGGLLPIHWQSTAGEVQATDNPRIFTYQAPQRYMQDKITFYDRADQEAVILIDILRPLTVSPKLREVKTGESTSFTIQGGSGDWQVIENAGLKTEKIHGNKLTVSADKTTGTRQIIIQDSQTDEQQQLMLEIYAPLKLTP